MQLCVNKNSLDTESSKFAFEIVNAAVNEMAIEEFEGSGNVHVLMHFLEHANSYNSYLVFGICGLGWRHSMEAICSINRSTVGERGWDMGTCTIKYGDLERKFLCVRMEDGSLEIRECEPVVSVM